MCGYCTTLMPGCYCVACGRRQPGGEAEPPQDRPPEVPYKGDGGPRDEGLGVRRQAYLGSYGVGGLLGGR